MNSDIMADNIVDTNTMAGKVVTILIALLFIVVLAFPIANTLSNGSGESGGSGSGDDGKLVFTTADFTSINTDGLEAEQVLFSITGKVTTEIEGDMIEDSRGVSVIVKERDGSLVPYWQMVNAGPMSSGLYDGYIVTTPFENPPSCIWDITVEVDEDEKTANVSIKTNNTSAPLDEVTPSTCTISDDNDYPFEFTYNSNVISSSSSDSGSGSATLNNPEPYSMRYSYADGTIPDFSIGIATDMQAHTITVTTENGTVTINPTNLTILLPSYVVLATDTSFITPFEAGVIYANEDGTMYVLLNGTIQCANGQLSLIPNGENSILDVSSMTPVSGNVALGIVERCYYADFNGEYGNYFNTQIGSGLYYDSSKPVYSYGLSDNGIVFNDFVFTGDEQMYVGSVTSTITTSDNLYTGTTWTGGSLADGETVERYWTILPTSVSNDDGGNGGSGVGGVAGTLIKLVPILMIVGLLMMFIVPMVYKPN